MLVEPHALTLNELFDIGGAIGNVDEYFARTIVSSNESKTFFAVVEFNCTSRHCRFRLLGVLFCGEKGIRRHRAPAPSAAIRRFPAGLARLFFIRAGPRRAKDKGNPKRGNWLRAPGAQDGRPVRNEDAPPRLTEARAVRRLYRDRGLTLRRYGIRGLEIEG